MDTDSIIVHIKTEDISVDIAKDVETSFDTRNNKLETPLPRRKNKKLIALIKDNLAGKIIIEFHTLMSKSFNYLINDGDENKKNKKHKKVYPKTEF